MESPTRNVNEVIDPGPVVAATGMNSEVASLSIATSSASISETPSSSDGTATTSESMTYQTPPQRAPIVITRPTRRITMTYQTPLQRAPIVITRPTRRPITRIQTVLTFPSTPALPAADCVNTKIDDTICDNKSDSEGSSGESAADGSDHELQLESTVIPSPTTTRDGIATRTRSKHPVISDGITTATESMTYQTPRRRPSRRAVTVQQLPAALPTTDYVNGGTLSTCDDRSDSEGSSSDGSELSLNQLELDAPSDPDIIESDPECGPELHLESTESDSVTLQSDDDESVPESKYNSGSSDDSSDDNPVNTVTNGKDEVKESYSLPTVHVPSANIQLATPPRYNTRASHRSPESDQQELMDRAYALQVQRELQFERSARSSNKAAGSSSSTSAPLGSLGSSRSARLNSRITSTCVCGNADPSTVTTVTSIDIAFATSAATAAATAASRSTAAAVPAAATDTSIDDLVAIYNRPTIEEIANHGALFSSVPYSSRTKFQYRCAILFVQYQAASRSKDKQDMINIIAQIMKLPNEMLNKHIGSSNTVTAEGAISALTTQTTTTAAATVQLHPVSDASIEDQSGGEEEKAIEDEHIEAESEGGVRQRVRALSRRRQRTEGGPQRGVALLYPIEV